MWFKNATLWRLEQGFSQDEQSLEKALNDYPLGDCEAGQLSTAGWLSPFGEGHDKKVHAVQGGYYLEWGVREKVLPPGVIRETLQEKIRQFEKREAGVPGGKMKRQLKDEAIADLLPRAFTQVKQTGILIDPESGWLLVDSASRAKAELATEHLRQALGSLKLASIEESPAFRAVLTNWLREGQAENGFALMDECELRHLQEDSLVRCRGMELDSAEIRQYLDEGLEPVRLALAWNDTLEFVLQDGLILRRMRFTDRLKEGLEEVSAEDALAELDALRALQLMEFRALLKDLASHFPVAKN